MIKVCVVYQPVYDKVKEDGRIVDGHQVPLYFSNEYNALSYVCNLNDGTKSLDSERVMERMALEIGGDIYIVEQKVLRSDICPVSEAGIYIEYGKKSGVYYKSQVARKEVFEWDGEERLPNPIGSMDVVVPYGDSYYLLADIDPIEVD